MINILELQKLRQELLAKITPDLLNPDLVAKIAACRIELSDKMRSTAGTANSTQNRIKLNNRLLSINPQHINQTFTHELAHLVANAMINGRAKHGPVWKQVMRLFGVEPNRTHSLDTSQFRRIKAIARCNCTEHNITPRRYTFMTNGRTYRCLKCKERLTLVQLK